MIIASAPINVKVCVFELKENIMKLNFKPLLSNNSCESFKFTKLAAHRMLRQCVHLTL